MEAGYTFTANTNAAVNAIFDAAASDIHTNGTDIFGWCATDCGFVQVITVTGPGGFSISSIDIGHLFVFTDGMAVNLTGYFSGGGSISATLAVEPQWVTHGLAGFVGLSSLEISAVDPHLVGVPRDSAIDNLVLTQIPEPLAVLLLGLGLVVTARRLARTSRSGAHRRVDAGRPRSQPRRRDVVTAAGGAGPRSR
jgi:hypothetical protein